LARTATTRKQRPFYYIDPFDQQRGPPSNKWVIAFEGGGSRGAMRGDNAAAACMSMYVEIDARQLGAELGRVLGALDLPAISVPVDRGRL
jgi:hypothetical protein